VTTAHFDARVDLSHPLHSLKHHGTDAEADAMFEMSAHTMALPLEEKMKYEQGDDGNSFGYIYLLYPPY